MSENNRVLPENGELKKSLNPMPVWSIAFGCIIGWGSFVNPGKKFLPNSGVAGTAIAMVLGALVMVIIAFSYAYMVPKYPKAGGEFTFAQNCFGKHAAFICGWFLVVAYLTNVPMNSTAIGLIVDGLDGTADILKFGWHYSIAGFDVWMGETLFASAILILFGIFNILGVKKAGFIQTVLAVTLAVCAFTLCIAAIVSPKANGVNMQPIWGFDKKSRDRRGRDGCGYRKLRKRKYSHVYPRDVFHRAVGIRRFRHDPAGGGRIQIRLQKSNGDHVRRDSVRMFRVYFEQHGCGGNPRKLAGTRYGGRVGFARRRRRTSRNVR